MFAGRGTSALLGLVTCLFSLALLVGSRIPVPRQTQVFTLDAATLRLPTTSTSQSSAGQGDAPGIKEARGIRLDLPQDLTVGRPETVQLVVTAGGDGAPGVAASAEPDVYATHHVVAVAALQSSDLSVSPEGELGETLLPGKPATFRWAVSAARSGDAVAALTLRLRYYPNVGGTPVENLIVARELSFGARSVLGLSGPTASWVGVVGAGLGAIVVLVTGQRRFRRRRKR